MSRSRIASFALCLVGVLAACLAFAGTASAATHPPAFRPQLTGPGAVRPLFAPAASSPAAGAQAEYSCSFAAYGSGIAPVTVSMTSEVQTPWPVNQPDEVTVANDDAITLPSAVSSQLTGIDSITAESQVTAKNATQSTIDLQGAAIASSPVTLTEIPAQVTAVGEVTFPAKGTTGSVALPAQTVTFTPFAGTTAKPVITCTTASTATDDSVTVGDASGPFYNCTATIAGAGSETSAGPVDMTFSSSGTKKTGDSVTITVASPDIASLVSQLNGVSAITQAAVSADLAVTGAQSGTLHLSKTVTDVTATTFSMSGSLKLTKAGTVKIDIPSKFGVALSASGTVVLDVSCSLVTQPAPVALTLTVAQGTSTSPSTCATPSPTTTVTVTETPTTTVTPTVTVTPTTENGVATVTPTVTVTPTTTVTPTVTVTPTTTSSPTPCASSTSGSGGTTEASGTPVGGADTGGGAAPGGDVALAIAGAALLLTGCGLVLRGGRRGAFARVRSGWRRRLTRGR